MVSARNVTLHLCVSVLFVFCCLCVDRISAYPWGAGSCEAGALAGGFRHSVNRGTLESHGINVTINGSVIKPKKPFLVRGGKVVNINVSSHIVGILIRLEAKDGTTDLTGKLDLTNADVKWHRTQIQSLCTPPVVGITHTSSKNKKSVGGNFFTDGFSGIVAMDITTVPTGNQNFYHSHYILNVSTAVPVPSPKRQPVPIHVPVPASKPKPVPVHVPVPAPKRKPVTIPVHHLPARN